MSYISEQTLLDYFLEMDKTLSLDDLSDRFGNFVRLDDVYRTANSLVVKGLLKDVGGDSWALSDKAKRLVKEQAEKEQKETEKSTKEYEKLHLEIENLRNQFFDYNKVKNQAKWSLICAMASAVAAIIALVK